jgi:hypothetical protein
MRKYNLLILFVLPLAILHGQERVISYVPTLVEGAGILEVTETYMSATGSGYVNKTLVRSADTAAMRKYMVAEMAFQDTEAERYEALKTEAAAKRDSLYQALVVLNEGLGAADSPAPLRQPADPANAPERWGAILPKDETEKTG